MTIDPLQKCINETPQTNTFPIIVRAFEIFDHMTCPEDFKRADYSIGQAEITRQ